MALTKPENQPYAIIFRVHNKQNKLSVCMENNLEIVCGVRPKMNDTLGTGKSTLCCYISIIDNKQKNYLFARKTILRLFVVCVPLRMTLLVPENQPYAIILCLHSRQKYLFAWKTVYTGVGPALTRGVHRVPGAGPWRGLQGGSGPCLRKFCIW